MPVNQVYFYSYKSKKRGILWYYLYKEIGVKKFKKVRGFLTKRDAKKHFEETFGINVDEINNQTKLVTPQQYININDIQNQIDNAVQKALSNIQTVTTETPQVKISFKDIIKHYIEHIKKTGAKATWTLYEGLFDNHLQLFHSYAMHEVTRKITKQWRDDKHKNGDGYATINNCIKLARAAINYAVDDEEFDFSLCGGKNPFSIDFVKAPYKDVEHLDLEEAFFMLQKCLDMFGFEWFFVFLVLAAFTGMRQGEIFGIDVERIDFKNSIIKVRYQYTHGEYKPELKTDSSYRDVDIPPFVVQILKAYIRKKRIFRGALLTGERLKNRISRSFMGKRYWKPLLIECEFQNRNITPHTLRACFTDFCLEENIDDKFVQGMLGHSSITTTKNIYAKKTKKMGEQYKQKIQEVCSEFTEKLNWNF